MSHDHDRVPDYARLNNWDRPHDVYMPPDVPQYTGAIVSFCKRPLIESPEALEVRKPDVVIMGAPFDDAVTYRPGARFGPRAIRQASYNHGGHSLQLGVEPFEVLDVVDAGDANVDPGGPRAWPRHDLPEGARDRLDRCRTDHPRRRSLDHLAQCQRDCAGACSKEHRHRAFRRTRRYRKRRLGCPRRSWRANAASDRVWRGRRTQLRPGWIARLLAAAAHHGMDARARYALAPDARDRGARRRGGRRRCDLRGARWT